LRTEKVKNGRNRSKFLNFIALPKCYVTHRNYEILSKSLVPIAYPDRTAPMWVYCVPYSSWMLAVTPSNMLDGTVKEALDGTGLEPVGGTDRLLAAASGSSILQSAVEEVTRVSIQVSNMTLSAELTCYSPNEEFLALIFTRLPYRRSDTCMSIFLMKNYNLYRIQTWKSQNNFGESLEILSAVKL
jgi:hypothetical protein